MATQLLRGALKVFKEVQQRFKANFQEIMAHLWRCFLLPTIILAVIAIPTHTARLSGVAVNPVAFNNHRSSSSSTGDWRTNFGEGSVAATTSGKSSGGGNSTAGVTYYWGSHQVGESVLAFGKDLFTSAQPRNAFRTISYQNNNQCRISYLEVFVRNSGVDQVYLTHGGIGASFVGVFIGSQSPTTYFEYKATLYGFE